MKIAVINETSAADRNADIISALEGRDHIIINAGMKKNSALPELTYIHTGLLTALFLNLKAADFVIGGCGTGQGYLNAAMQYPGVFCGLVLNPLDAWLFTQINGGNAISLQLNQGFGWASEINLRMIFDALFSVESGVGFPPHRQKSQQESRNKLSQVSGLTHLNMSEIIQKLPNDIVDSVMTYPGIFENLDYDSLPETPLKQVLGRWR